MPISLCITTFERYDLTIKSFEKVIDDPRIDDIVILDDDSKNGDCEKLQKYFEGNEKVRLLRQFHNRGMSLNKRDAISYAGNEFVLLWDSDNIFDASYLDALDTIGELRADTIYCPDFARPKFNFKHFGGQIFDRSNIKDLVSDSMGNVSANTCNYVVPRDEYLRVYQHNPEMKATDTVYFALLWLKAGNKFHIVKDMEYDHLTHPQSGFLQHCNYNMAKSAEIREQILAL